MHAIVNEIVRRHATDIPLHWGRRDQTVFLVDDDADVRCAVESLLLAHDLRVVSFSSAEEFLQHGDTAARGCLILDMRLGSMTGLDLQHELSARGSTLPIIFLSAYGDVPLVVEAMRAGAVDYLTKPFERGRLLGAVGQALQVEARWHDSTVSGNHVRHRVAQLSDLERRVMELTANGLAQKQIARRMGIALRTVQWYRTRLMKKLGIDSVAELIEMALLNRIASSGD